MVWKWALPQLQFQFNRNRTSWYLYSLDPFLCLFRGVNRIPRVPAWNSPVPRKAGKGESSTGRDRNSNDNDSSRQSRYNNGSERRSFFHSMKRRRGRRVGRARAREREREAKNGTSWSTVRSRDNEMSSIRTVVRFTFAYNVAYTASNWILIPLFL